MPTTSPFCPSTLRIALIALAFLALVATLPASLDACPTATKLLEHMGNAHGGMDGWASAPTVCFEDEFKLGEATTGLVSRVCVEQGQRRAYIDYPGTPMTMAWDGAKAWSTNWALPYPPRFMALLNYHFLNLPWLANDPGVILSEFGRRTLGDDPTEYFSVKITYEEGTGDTPRDYYRLYVHPESHLLKAVEYIVTYKSLLPEGVTETPPNTLIYEDFTEVAGLKVPSNYTIYQADGTVFGSAEIREWSFGLPFDEARMTMPEGATLDESMP